MNLKHAVYGSILTTVVVFFTYSFIDLPIARFFSGMLNKGASLSREYSPFVRLPPLVWVATAASWMAWLVRDDKKDRDMSFRFFRYIGFALPVAFAAKFALKPLFSRPGPELCLLDSSYYGFHWFNGAIKGDAFPSGHMTVFTVATLALWRFFPRYRFFYLFFLLVLATALVVFDFHFVSDVIAGAYLGMVVDSLLYKEFSRRRIV